MPLPPEETERSLLGLYLHGSRRRAPERPAARRAPAPPRAPVPPADGPSVSADPGSVRCRRPVCRLGRSSRPACRPSRRAYSPSRPTPDSTVAVSWGVDPTAGRRSARTPSERRASDSDPQRS